MFHPEDNKNTPQVVDAVVKALDILDCFTTSETELSLTQLSEKTGLYKSRVHRLCATLMQSGYLVKRSRTLYRLGPKLMVLGKVYEKTASLRSIAVPFMRQLTEDTGESTVLYLIDGMKSVCMAREMGHSRLVYAINEGDTMELTPTAAGRVLLAYAAPELVDKVLSRITPTRYTEHTKVDVAEIKKELELIRERGYDVNDQERERGIAAIAAPIFDFNRSVYAALVIVGPAHRFAGGNRVQLLARLLETTGRISQAMGTT